MSTKHVTIVEPPVRPSVSADDFDRTGKSNSGKNVGDIQSLAEDLRSIRVSKHEQ